MNFFELLKVFTEATENDAKFIGVKIETEGNSEPEIIINPNANFHEKYTYYSTAYDENLVLKATKGKKQIKITAAAYGNRFDDIESQLVEEQGKGWKELIVNAIDNAYNRMIEKTPPTSEEEKIRCETILEAVKGTFINETRTATEAEFIKRNIFEYEKMFDICMNGDGVAFRKGLIELQKKQNEFVMKKEQEQQ